MDWQALWLRLEARLLDLMDERGESRNSLSLRLGHGRHYLNPHLGKEPEPGEPPKASFRHAFEAAEALGYSATAVLAPFCAAEPPERILATLHAEGDDRGKNKARKTPDEEKDDELLAAARRLIERIPCSPGSFETPWPKRRFEEPDFEPVYRELEGLDARRHSEPLEVAERCHGALLEAADDGDEATLPEAIRLVGYLGLWGTVQRTRFRLRPARDAFVVSLPLARKLGDPSLLANQLQRAAYAFRDLGQVEMAVRVLDEASRHYSLDDNDVGNAYVLVDHGNMAFHRNDLPSAERYYLAGVRELPKQGHNVHRVAAIQGVATCRDLRGDVTAALNYLTAAAAKVDHDDPRARAALIFPAANIERRLKDFESAESKYREALELLKGIDDTDGIVRICIDFATCLVQSGREAGLGELREILMGQLPKFKNKETLQFQVECLLRELSGEPISLEALAQLKSEVNQARW